MMRPALLGALLALPLLAHSNSLEDPFAHPKFALSFLNDLPVEQGIATRWLADSGLEREGGQSTFFRLGADHQQSARTGSNEIEAGQAQEQAVESPPGDDALASAGDQGAPEREEASSAPQNSNYTLQKLLLGPNARSYLCLVPVPPPQSSLPPPPPPPPIDPALPEQLLKHLKGTCLYHRQGWFTYTYCHGEEARQFREAQRAWSPTAGAYVPQEDPDYDAYILGRAAIDQNQEQHLPPISIGRGLGQRYLVQRWGGGTMCTQTGKGREVEIQFHCSMTGTDSIGLIKEISTCNYILIINTPRLCNIPGFSSAHMAEPPSSISCREIVPDGSLPPALLDPATVTSRDRTPLPSWAIIAPPPPALGKQQKVPSSPEVPSKAPVEDMTDARALLERLLRTLSSEGALAVQPDGQVVVDESAMTDEELDELEALEHELGIGLDGDNLGLGLSDEDGVVFLRMEEDGQGGMRAVMQDAAAAGERALTPGMLQKVLVEMEKAREERDENEGQGMGQGHEKRKEKKQKKALPPRPREEL